jgi:hypothetical protein
VPFGTDFSGAVFCVCEDFPGQAQQQQLYLGDGERGRGILLGDKSEVFAEGKECGVEVL